MMFLHGGLIHILLNMWCLAVTGPLIERLYGNYGFALLYLISGLGGALASSWWHPLVVGVGASGAIFGVLGGMIAFLLLHRHTIPRSVLEPLRSGVVGMVGYNIVFGLRSPTIDNAGHIGGLATGFLAGLVLCRRWPALGPLDGVRRQTLGAAALAAALVPLGVAIRGEIRKDSDFVRVQRQLLSPVEEYNTFIRAMGPRLEQFDALNGRVDRLLDALNRGRPVGAELNGLIQDAELLKGSLQAVPVGNGELDALRGDIDEAGGALARALAALKRAAAFGDASEISGPDGFNANRGRCNAAVEKFSAGVTAYFKKHDMTQVPLKSLSQ
jgi:rhomboid protease GluP